MTYIILHWVKTVGFTAAASSQCRRIMLTVNIHYSLQVKCTANMQSCFKTVLWSYGHSEATDLIIHKEMETHSGNLTEHFIADITPA